jgi:hypothetical protein
VLEKSDLRAALATTHLMAARLRPVIEKAAAFQAKHYKNMQAGSTPFTGWFRTRAEGRLRDCERRTTTKTWGLECSPPLFSIDVQCGFERDCNI